MVLASEESDVFILKITWVFAVIGVIYAVKFLLCLLIDLWTGFTTFLLPKLGRQVDLINNYGPWAVVTGSTDGVGKAYAMELAKRGMNVCLISRSVEKLQASAKEIETKYPDVKIMWIQADYSRTDIYEHIRKEIADLDIGILVNNVGIANDGPETFLNQSEEFFWKIININIAATVIMTSIIVPGMVKRKRGLIVNMSSQSGEIPVPMMSVYASTKAFVNMFSTCLELELKNENIRVQCLLGGWIVTKLLDNYTGVVKLNRRFFPTCLPNAEQYVASAVNTISSSNNYTCGYWGHSLFMVITQFATGRYLQGRIAKAMLNSSP